MVDMEAAGRRTGAFAVVATGTDGMFGGGAADILGLAALGGEFAGACGAGVTWCLGLAAIGDGTEGASGWEVAADFLRPAAAGEWTELGAGAADSRVLAADVAVDEAAPGTGAVDFLGLVAVVEWFAYPLDGGTADFRVLAALSEDVPNMGAADFRVLAAVRGGTEGMLCVEAEDFLGLAA